MLLPPLKPLRHLMPSRSLAELVAQKLELRRPPVPVESPLAPVAGFGSNPGALLAWSFVPPGLAPGAPLVVVLHGCTQSAAGYDRGAVPEQFAAVSRLQKPVEPRHIVREIAALIEAR